MAGHSHWAGIKHKKAVIDNKRGKVWSKCSKAIIVAAKLGGGDADMNPRLRLAVADAKAANMPIMARPWISHLMLYIHSKLCWNRDLDIQATMNEYFELFYGPARAEMKEWMWLKPR